MFMSEKGYAPKSAERFGHQAMPLTKAYVCYYLRHQRAISLLVLIFN